MKLSWLFNGTMQAHHLMGAYLVVWGIQGGYAAWVAWQLFHVGAVAKPTNALTSMTRDRK